MSRISVLVLLALTCTTSCVDREADNVRIVTEMVEAINDRDLDRLDILVADDIVRHSAATAGVVITNLDEFKEFLRADFAGVPDSVISIDIILGNSEYVALRAIYSGTQTGPVGPFPPSGNSVELPYLAILRIVDGEIAEMWVEWDNVFMLTQLGHFPHAAVQQEGQTGATELTEFATRYAAAWSSQDPVELASFYAENGSLRVNDGEPSIGRDAVTETARAFMTAFPDMVVRLVELRRSGDHVEFHWHWTGTNTGPGGTGNAVDLRGYEQWTLDDDGRIVKSLGHFDDAEYQRQLNAGSATIE